MQDEMVIQPVKARQKGYSAGEGNIEGYQANKGNIKMLFTQRRQN